MHSEKMGSKNSPSKRLSLTSEGKSSELGHFLLISESIPAKKKKIERINGTQLIQARGK